MDLSAGGLLAGLVVSTAGFGFFSYGKKQGRVPQILAGLSMMVFPVFVGGTWPVLGIGAALGGGVWLAVRTGY